MNMLMTLQARQTASLALQGKVRVRCLRGMLWIVGQRDGEDCVLEAGQSTLLGAQRHYLSSVCSKEAVSFELQPPPARRTGPGGPRPMPGSDPDNMPGSDPDKADKQGSGNGGCGSARAEAARWWQRLRQFL